VQGFLNPKTGQYQTLEGKNINHLGINVKPAFAKALEALGFGEEDEELFDFPIGSIKGTFTGYNPKSNIGILEVFKKNKERAAQLKRMQEEAEAAAAEAAQRQATRNLAEQNRRDTRGGYQSSFGKDKDFMGGSGKAKDMGSFMDGGIVDLVDIYD
jgi:hypothetical protein